MHLFPRAMIALGVIAAVASADEVKLKDGRVFEGRVVSREDGRLVLLVPGGKKLVFEDARIDAVTPRRSAFDEHDERAAGLGSGAPAEERLRLARWCHLHGLEPEMRAQLRVVLARDPQCEEAHRLLGEIEVSGRWLPREEALPKLGWRKIAGVWRDPEEVLAIDRQKAVAKRRRELEARMNRLAGVLFDGTNKEAIAAYHELVDLARAERIAGLEPLARRLYDEGREAAATAMLEVRLQKSTLKSLRPRTLSLGTGSAVTLELPESENVGVGTTVVVPVR